MTRVDIDITTILSADLKSRSSVSVLMSHIENIDADEFVIDFSKVLFATRSFADEFYNRLLRSGVMSAKVLTVNMSADIEMVFDAVKLTQNRVKRKTSRGRVVELNSIAELSCYLERLAF